MGSVPRCSGSVNATISFSLTVLFFPSDTSLEGHPQRHGAVPTQEETRPMSGQVRMWAFMLTLIAVGQAMGGDQRCATPQDGPFGSCSRSVAGTPMAAVRCTR